MNAKRLFAQIVRAPFIVFFAIIWGFGLLLLAICAGVIGANRWLERAANGEPDEGRADG